jgi:hypothetical protein
MIKLSAADATGLSYPSGITSSIVTIVAVSSVSLSGCRSLAPIEYQVEPSMPVIGCAAQLCPDADQIAVTYLGVSGFVVRHAGSTLLTGPSFTNPSLDSVTPAFLRFFRGDPPLIVSDTNLIERLLPREADDASMILIGHGHYDHLLDLPYVADRRARRAVVYGSPTVRHMLMGDSALRANPSRVVAIQATDLGSADRMGRWFYSADSAFRVMALVADHAPTVRVFGWGPMFAPGVIDHDLDRLPSTAEDWKLGEPYAFVIDVLARGAGGAAKPIFRIYYQDAPNTAPLGFPPPAALLGYHAFDLAILCVATSRNVDPPAPDSLLAVLRPRYVIAAHWESFFRPQTLPLMLNPASDVDAFMISLTKRLPTSSGWTMPMPRTTMHFAAQP